jgi:hypothetical protein
VSDGIKIMSILPRCSLLECSNIPANREAKPQSLDLNATANASTIVVRDTVSAAVR